MYCASLFRRKVYNLFLQRCLKRKQSNRKENKLEVQDKVKQKESSVDIHTNPLVYRSEFVEVQEVINPHYGFSETRNPLRSASHASVRRVEKQRSERMQRLMKIRRAKSKIETNKTARGTKELELSDTIINPMKRENTDTSHKNARI